MIKRWLSNPLLQIALAVAIYGALGWKFGPIALAILAPGLAAAVARPLLNLMGNFRDGVREHVLLPLHGSHFVFRDVTIHVVEDEDHCRWVSLADARKITPIGASEAALHKQFGERFRKAGKPAQAYLRDDALVAYLSRSTDLKAVRFRTWVERTVAMPAQRLRERAGVRLDDDGEQAEPQAPSPR